LYFIAGIKQKIGRTNAGVSAPVHLLQFGKFLFDVHGIVVHDGGHISKPDNGFLFRILKRHRNDGRHANAEYQKDDFDVKAKFFEDDKKPIHAIDRHKNEPVSRLHKKNTHQIGRRQLPKRAVHAVPAQVVVPHIRNTHNKGGIRGLGRKAVGARTFAIGTIRNIDDAVERVLMDEAEGKTQQNIYHITVNDKLKGFDNGLLFDAHHQVVHDDVFERKQKGVNDRGNARFGINKQIRKNNISHQHQQSHGQVVSRLGRKRNDISH